MVRNVPTVSENHLITKDGRKLLVEWHGRHIPGEDGQPEALFGVGIRDRPAPLMEEVLQRERDEAQTYLDLAGVMFLALDADGRVTMVNHKGCEILKAAESGRRRQGRGSTRSCPKRTARPTRRAFRGLMTGQIQLFEHHQNRVLTATGEKRVVEWHNALIRDPDGRIKGTLSSGIDITERRRAEELQQVMQQIATAVHTCRSTSELFTDHPERARQGHQHRELLHRALQQGVRHHLAQLLRRPGGPGGLQVLPRGQDALRDT